MTKKSGKVLLPGIMKLKFVILSVRNVILCSTVIGSFFQDFVKIFNKIRAEVGS
jgi:hypothetical protein